MTPVSEPTREQAFTAIQRAMHQRKTDLLRDPLSVEVIRYRSVNSPPLSSDEVALLTRLEQHKRQLWEDAARIYEQYNLREDDLTVVIPEFDLPLPDTFDTLRYQGMRLTLGKIDDRYRVARLAEFRK